MAATKISDYAIGGSNWSELLTAIEKQRKGYNGVSLTNYDNGSLPAIAAGSYFEISGALYGFTSETAITGTPTSGSTNYIYIDGTTFAPVWTTTAPTWSDSKNGWYDAGETNRYVGGCYYDGTNYTGKWVYQLRSLEDIPDGTTYKRVAGINSSNKITNGSFNATGAYTTAVINAGATWTPSAGIYMYVTGHAVLQIYSGSSWYPTNVDTSQSGFLVTDGINYRFYNFSTYTGAVYYRKLD